MDAQRRRLRLLLVYAALALPAIGWGAYQALQNNHNSPLDWAPRSFPQRAEYAAFCEQFGPGDTVVASWPDCTLAEERLDRLATILRKSRVFYDEQDQWLFHRVVTGREAVAALTGAAGQPSAAPAFTSADAAARLAGSLVGPDGQQTAVVVTFTAAGLAQRERLVDAIRAAATYACGVADADLRLAGPVIDGLAVDRASQQTLQRYAAPSAVIVFVLCWASLRSLRAAAVVFGLSVVCQGATLALVHYAGDSMSALLIVLPPLVQVLAVAGGIHLANYFFDAQEAGIAEPAGHAFRMGWLPCALSAGTTAIGMASLMSSDLSPIRSFGAYSSAGVLLIAAALLSLLPALFFFWPPRRAWTTGARAKTATSSLRAGGPSGWLRWSQTIASHQATIAVAGMAAIAAGGWFARELSTSVRIDTFFAGDHRVIEDYRWLERRLGPLAPMEVLVQCAPDCPSTTTQRLELMWRLGRQLSGRSEVSRPLSAAECVPPLPLDGLPAEQRPAVVERTLASLRPQFEQLGLWRGGEDGEAWRLTVRASALEKIDYDALLADVRSDVDQVLAATGATPPSVRVRVTGVMPLVHAIQRQLLRDLISSFAAALVVIAVVMTLAQAGVAAGLVAMASNVFPIAVFFGWLGWRGDPVDIGTVMTASIALGIAVDDTLHFLTFFRRRLGESNDRRCAVSYALQHCGPAMIQTSLSCGVGMLAFALSDFLPTSRFATSIVALLLLALLGDLLLLPALLLGPLGRVFVDWTSAVGESPLDAGASVQPISVATRPAKLAAAVARPRRQTRLNSWRLRK